MKRTMEEIIEDIRPLRAENRELYTEMQKILLNEDVTLNLVAAAYAVDPVGAKHIHRQIAKNDALILKLTEEICE